MTDLKLIKIYDALLNGRKNKEELAKILGKVSIKTIENKIKLSEDDIQYSKKMGTYHFKNLLPRYVTYSFLNLILIDNFNNLILKRDIVNIQQSIADKIDNLFETTTLSETLKNLIIFNIAINHNIVLSVDYMGNKKDKESKIIQPNQVFMTKGLYYFYITYDDKNSKDIGKQRTFNLNAVSNIEFVEYKFDKDSFKTTKEGNEYGHYSDERYVYMTFSLVAANFIKRERLNFLKWDFINESYDGKSVNIKLYYNSKFELKRLVQQWAPDIRFTGETKLSKEILGYIKKDFEAIS